MSTLTWVHSSFLVIFLIILTLLVSFLRRSKNYWISKGVPQREDARMLLGNANFNKSISLQFVEHYNYFKATGAKVGGIYILMKPFLVPVDLDLIKNIMVKDFDHFVNHQTGIQVDYEVLSGHLFNLTDDKWKSLRVKLSPTFTSGKMKMMYQTFIKCTENLNDMLMEHASLHDAVDIKEILGSFTTDIIGNCAFGLECNSMKNPDSEFRKYGRKIFESNGFERYRRILIQTLPKPIVHFFRMKFFNDELAEFFIRTVKEIVDYREKNGIFRRDFMHLLLQLKNRGVVADDDKIRDESSPSKDAGINMDELIAQCFVFFAAGFETSSTVMTFALFELASNQDIQSKLREEIRNVLKKYDNNLTYEAISEMKYLERVLQESLRKYPPIGMIPRECSKDYQVPDTNIVIEKRTRMGIPVMGIHMDPEYYPNPEKFDPDRFTEENKAKRPQFTFLPFGEGPRICIGLRFGMLQSKVGLATIIRNYNVTLNNKTETPLVFDPTVFVTTAKGGVWLNINKV